VLHHQANRVRIVTSIVLAFAPVALLAAACRPFDPSLRLRGHQYLGNTVGQVSRRLRGIRGIEEFVTGFEDETLAVDDVFHPAGKDGTHTILVIPARAGPTLLLP
jgi:hypothetical protein